MEEGVVGYGKPPKEHQWKAGQSGNPAGYPVGVPNRGTVLKRMLGLKAAYTQPDGTLIDGTAEDMINMAMIAKASMGDVPAYNAIMDSVYGKMTDKTEVSLPAKTVIRIGGKRPKPANPEPEADAADD